MISNLKLEEVNLVPLKNVIKYLYCDANISTQPLIKGGKTNMSHAIAYDHHCDSQILENGFRNHECNHEFWPMLSIL